MSLVIRCSVVAVVFCPFWLGCGGSRYPESRFRPVAVPADVPAELHATLEKLNSPDPLVRAHAARTLGTRVEAEGPIVSCLLAALQDENAMVCAAAAAALGRIGDRSAVAPLVELLRDTQEDRDVRSRAAEALGQLHAAEAVPALTAALNDTVWHVRLHAANALGTIVAPEARTALENAARYDPDFTVRQAALAALQQTEPLPENGR